MSAHAVGKIFRSIILPVVVISLSACATMKKPLTGIDPGKQVETLQSAVGVTAKSGDRSTSGRGYLLFKQPDRFHMAVLSPFGLTLLDVFSIGDRLTCLIPSKEVAYSGALSELPDTSALKGLGMLSWVVTPPPPSDLLSGREVTTAARETLYFDDNGLLSRKVSEQGDEVVYNDYRNRNGVAFPDSIVITNRYGASVKISFEEPEINLPVEDSALAPNLEGYRVLPLADFKGF